MDAILERWNRAISLIRAAGYTVREEWLEGEGGLCEFKGEKYFFSDQSLSLLERLEQVEAAVRKLKLSSKN